MTSSMKREKDGVHTMQLDLFLNSTWQLPPMEKTEGKELTRWKLHLGTKTTSMMDTAMQYN